MYGLLKGILLKVLKVPSEPSPPRGDEDSLQTFRAAPAYFRYKLLKWAIGLLFSAALVVWISGMMIVMGVAALVEESLVGGLMIAGGAVLLLGFGINLFFSYASVRLDYEMRWYMITDRSLRIREGVKHVREMTMTFANIQNISVNQGPIQRFFGIADLKVETAGGGGAVTPQGGDAGADFGMHVGFFRGIDNAPEIRDLMLARLKRLRDSGLGTPDEASEHGEAADASVLEALQALRDEARAMAAAVKRR